MAEEKEAGSQNQKKSKKMILVGGVVLVLLAGGGFFAWNKMMTPKGGEEQTSEEGGKGEPQVEFLSLDPFVVNLKGSGGNKYMKVVISLEADKKTAEEVRSKTPLIRDSIIILLSSKGYVDVGSVQGKYQLRDEILARINKVLTKGKVKGVYFTDFVIQ